MKNYRHNFGIGSPVSFLLPLAFAAVFFSSCEDEPEESELAADEELSQTSQLGQPGVPQQQIAQSVAPVGSDTTPPAAPVVTGVSVTDIKRPSWTWTSSSTDANQGTGNFRYKINADEWVETTEKSFIPSVDLPLASHTLSTQERDTAGNWSLSGIHSINIMRVTDPAT